MSSRATNGALRDMRDEPAIISRLSGVLLMNWRGSSPSALTQSEDWLKMTNWIATDGVRRIFNEEAKHIQRDSTCLHETIADIEALAALEEDWNDEGAPGVDRYSLLWARNFVQRLACVAAEQNLIEDCAPDVFPTIDGGAKVSWKTNGHQVALVFRPGQRLIEIVEKSLGEAVSHRLVSETEAGDIAIRAMREAL